MDQLLSASHFRFDEDPHCVRASCTVCGVSLTFTRSVTAGVLQSHLAAHWEDCPGATP